MTSGDRTLANNPGDAIRTASPARWTVPRCPPDHIRVSRDLGNVEASHVDAGNRSTLQRRVVLPNPQHLLLTLNIETSLHEEKCPL